MSKFGFIYFMSNAHNNVLYVGVTSDLVRRVAEHKAKINKGFTCKYNCDKLVYFEKSDLIVDAIAREKQIKNWKREWKNALINKENPEWKDLADSIGVTEEVIENVKTHPVIAGTPRNPPDQRVIAGLPQNPPDQRVIAGTPHNPPDQRVIAGTPRNPPDQRVIAGLTHNPPDQHVIAGLTRNPPDQHVIAGLPHNPPDVAG